MFAVEPNRVVVSRHQFGRPGTSPPARLVQLSDLHLRAVGHHETRIAAAVAAIQPDLILLTGDAIDDAHNIPLLERFLALLDQSATKLAILGNWEHWGGVDLSALARAYGRANVQLLRNESIVVTLGGHDLLVTGLDDLVGGSPDERAAIRGIAPRPNHLLLAHCPMHRDLFRVRAEGVQSLPFVGAAQAHVDPALVTPHLMLAGHTHGGQVAPFGWAPLRPRGSGRYVRGWYRDAPTALYVSSGLGTSVVHARLHAVPEVACFEWSLADT
jgi:predicted MPP superfamily phosphohydrolase